MRKTTILFAVLLAAFACKPAVEATDDLIPSDEGLFPFVISYEMSKGAATDFSTLLEAPAGKDGFIRKKTGEIRFNPLYDWPHEAILGYIHYHRLALPPIYGWKDGYTQGTHAWPERDYCNSLNQGYREVWDIDHTVIEKAAEYIPSARSFLEGVSA